MSSARSSAACSGVTRVFEAAIGMGAINRDAPRLTFEGSYDGTTR
jgi:hypothetical protein